MLRSRADGLAGALQRRLRTALCRDDPAEAQEGSAVVEFTFLGTLMLIPVVYLILTVSQLQAGSFAVVGAADQAAKVYAASKNVAEAETRARQAADLAMADFGFEASHAAVEVVCAPAACLEPASSVMVRVQLRVPLPLVPTMPGLSLSAATVDSTATQMVGRFR
jgi:hypothetical protein